MSHLKVDKITSADGASSVDFPFGITERLTEGSPVVLDATGRVDAARLPVAVDVAAQGVHDASGGIYPAAPDEGDIWLISVAGTLGGTDYEVFDRLLYGNGTWHRIPKDEAFLQSLYEDQFLPAVRRKAQGAALMFAGTGLVALTSTMTFSSTFTIAGLLEFTSVSGAQVIAGHDADNFVSIDHDNSRFVVKVAGVASLIDCPVFAADRPYQIDITRDASNLIKVRVNGTLLADTETNSGTLSLSYLGSRAASVTEPLIGNMYRLQIFTRDLDAADLAKLPVVQAKDRWAARDLWTNAASNGTFTNGVTTNWENLSGVSVAVNDGEDALTFAADSDGEIMRVNNFSSTLKSWPTAGQKMRLIVDVKSINLDGASTFRFFTYDNTASVYFDHFSTVGIHVFEVTLTSGVIGTDQLRCRLYGTPSSQASIEFNSINIEFPGCEADHDFAGAGYHQRDRSPNKIDGLLSLAGVTWLESRKAVFLRAYGLAANGAAAYPVSSSRDVLPPATVVTRVLVRNNTATTITTGTFRLNRWDGVNRAEIASNDEDIPAGATCPLAVVGAQDLADMRLEVPDGADASMADFDLFINAEIID